MTEHTPTPWFKNRKLEIGPRPRTDDQCDGMLHPVADVFGDNRESDAAFIVKAVNNHDALVKALEVLLQEATSFSVSGVYFDEDCMGHKGPALARAILDLVSSPSGSDK